MKTREHERATLRLLKILYLERAKLDYKIAVAQMWVKKQEEKEAELSTKVDIIKR